MATPPKGPPTPEFEVPDLDVEGALQPAPNRRPSGTRAVAPVAPQPSPFGDDLDLGASAAASLELGTGAQPSGPTPGAGTMDQYFGGAFDASIGGDFEVDTSGALPLEPVAALDDTPWPSGLTPLRGDLAIDDARVNSAAAYGPPGPAVLAPVYAYRVFVRQQVLVRRRGETERAFNDAELKRAELLKEMVQSHRGEIERNERFTRLVEPLASLEAQARERQQAAAQVHGELASQLEVFDKKLAELEEQRVARQGVVTERAAEHTTAEEHFGRANAKLRRVQIEIRNLEAKVREAVGPQGGVVPPDMAAKLRPLQDQMRALEPNATTAKSALDAAQAKLREAQAAVTETTRAMAAVEKDKRTLMAKYESRIASSSASQHEAEQQEREAFLAIARAILDLRGAIAVDAETRKQITALDQLVERRLVDHEIAVRAVDAFDHERRSLGHKMAIGVVVLLLALIVVLAAV